MVYLRGDEESEQQLDQNEPRAEEAIP